MAVSDFVRGSAFFGSAAGVAFVSVGLAGVSCFFGSVEGTDLVSVGFAGASCFGGSAAGVAVANE